MFFLSTRIALLLAPLCLAQQVNVNFTWDWSISALNRKKVAGRAGNYDITGTFNNFKKFMDEQRDVGNTTNLIFPNECPFSIGTINCTRSSAKPKQFLGDSSVVSERNSAKLVVQMVLSGIYDVLCVQKISLKSAHMARLMLLDSDLDYNFEHMDEMANNGSEVKTNAGLCIFYNRKYVTPFSHFVSDSNGSKTFKILENHFDKLIREGYAKAPVNEHPVQNIFFKHNKTNRYICVQNVLLRKISSLYFSYAPLYDKNYRRCLKNSDVLNFLSITEARIHASLMSKSLVKDGIIYYMAGDFRMTDECMFNSILYSMMEWSTFSFLIRDIPCVLSDANVMLANTLIAYSLAHIYDPAELSKTIRYSGVLSNETKQRRKKYSYKNTNIWGQTDHIFYGSSCFFETAPILFQKFWIDKETFNSNPSALDNVQVGRGFVFTISNVM